MSLKKLAQRGLLSITALGAALMMAACGASAPGVENKYDTVGDYEMSYSSAYGDSAEFKTSTAQAANLDEEAAATGEPTPDEGRKIILNATVNMETLDYDKSYADIISAIEKAGGNISASNRQEDSTRARYSYISARIPSAQYNAFIEQLKDYGNVLSVNETSEDITTAYLDVAARLSSLQKQEARLNELVEKASSIEDMILLQQQLSSVQYEIEYYSSLQRTYDNQVSNSTVEISLQEVKQITETPENFGSRIAAAFRSGLRGAANFFEGLVLFFAAALPFLVILALVLVVLIVLLRKRKKNKKQAGAMQQAPLPPATGSQETK